MTTIFFAGAEVETLTRALLDNGVQNVLYSYFYVLTMRRERFIAQIQREYPHVRFLLDSGAFTYAVQTENNQNLPHYDRYVRRYFDYVAEYGKPYCRITEPDLDGIQQMPDVTIEMVDAWREEMLERFPDMNVQPVWHGWRGPLAWTRYVNDPRIKALAIGRGSSVGPAPPKPVKTKVPHPTPHDIGGPDSPTGADGMLRRMVNEAHLKGKPVHGFAMTKIQTTLRRVPFDSVDSTSWVLGQKYGTLYIFRGNKFMVLSKENGGKERRKLYRNYFKRIGCDPDKIIMDDVAEVRKANVIAWKRMGERLEEVQKRHGRNKMEDPDSPVAGGTPSVTREHAFDPHPSVSSGVFSSAFGNAAMERYQMEQSLPPRERERVDGQRPRERVSGAPQGDRPKAR